VADNTPGGPDIACKNISQGKDNYWNCSTYFTLGHCRAIQIDRIPRYIDSASKVSDSRKPPYFLVFDGDLCGGDDRLRPFINNTSWDCTYTTGLPGIRYSGLNNESRVTS